MSLWEKGDSGLSIPCILLDSDKENYETKNLVPADVLGLARDSRGYEDQATGVSRKKNVQKLERLSG